MLDLRTGELRFTNAGHNPPYRLRGGVVEAVTAAKGRPLGTRMSSAYDNATLALAMNDALYLYTDGVTEAENGNGDFFTEARLEDLLREQAGRSAKEMIDAVAGAVQAFAGAAPQSDDITALAVRRTVG
jgi:sigma-B regulation protein RsbU (phosphoserine phosphatase)